RDQVRWIPIWMQLIVDQAYVSDVLTSIANAPRLPIQITQWSWEHAHDIKPPTEHRVAQSGKKDSAPRVAAVEDPNLVELKVYGIASLYEKPSEPKAGTGRETQPAKR